MAILGIVLHNYCHAGAEGVKENQETFNAANCYRFFDSLSMDLISSLWQIFSFLGHYGIAIFIFISGYGLARKHQDYIPPLHEYLGHNAAKLWVLMIPGLFFYLTLALYEGNPLMPALSNIIGTFTFTANLTHPEAGYWKIAYGPYWYFGLTVQLCLVYRFIFHAKSSKRLIAATALVFIIEIAAFLIVGTDNNLIYWLRSNIFIAMPLFCLGIYFGREGFSIPEKVRKNPLIHTIIAVIVAVTLSLLPYGWAWFLSLFFWVPAVAGIAAILPQYLAAPLGWIGGISAWIFAIHPCVRELVWRLMGWYARPWTSLAVYLLLSIAAAYLLSLLMPRLLNRLRHNASSLTGTPS